MRFPRTAVLWSLALAACGQSPTDVAGFYAGRANVTLAGATPAQQDLGVRLRPGEDDQILLDDGLCRQLVGTLDDETVTFPAGECQATANGVAIVWRPSGSGRVRLGTLTYDLAGERTRTPQGGAPSTESITVRFVGDWLGP